MKFSLLSIATVLASAASTNAVTANICYLTALLGDIKADLPSFLPYAAQIPPDILDLALKAQTYTDDSYTTLVTPGFPYALVQSVVEGLPLYPQLSAGLEAAANGCAGAAPAPSASAPAPSASAPAPSASAPAPSASASKPFGNGTITSTTEGVPSTTIKTITSCSEGPCTPAPKPTSVAPAPSPSVPPFVGGAVANTAGLVGVALAFAALL